jgi:tRNA 2-thiouridine synthesizing protein A
LKILNDLPEALIVDARGHRCPVPTLKLRKALEEAPPSATVRLIADDPLARIDVPAFVAQIGYVLVNTSLTGGLLTFEVRKPAADAAAPAARD